MGEVYGATDTKLGREVAIEEEGDLYLIEQVSEGFDQLRPFVTGAGIPVWSKDGEWLYYRRGDGKEIWKKKAELIPGRGELIYAFDEGFQGRQQSESPDYLTIAPQGDGGDYDILRVDLKGGGAEWDEWRRASPEMVRAG
jgi:hypothetical protein